MANHSILHLKRQITPEDVEQAVAEINQRRFQDRLHLFSTPELTEGWRAERAWFLEAPNTRPKEPGPCYPDENKGFCFWLNRGRKTLEFRHVIFDRWAQWVLHIIEHETARHFGLTHFEDDGKVKVNPDRYMGSFRDWATQNFEKPLSASDAEFLQRHCFDYIPEGWE